MGGFDYPYEYVYESGLDSEIIGIVIALYAIIVLVAIVWGLVFYVLNSLGLYTIAERRGIRNPWLAWVPFGNVWILGSISDQYQYVAKGKVKNLRKILLGLEIVMVIVYTIQAIVSIASLIVGDAPILSTILGSVVGSILSMVILVLTYFAYNDLFHSCNPGNATMYLILSIVFSVTLPFFVFACRKKDLGMPPRKQAPAQQTVTVPEQTFTVPEQTFTVPEQTFTVPEQTVAAPVETEPVQQTPAEGYAQPEEFEE